MAMKQMMMRMKSSEEVEEFDFPGAGGGYPASPQSSPLKSLVKRQYRESLARAGVGPPRATVRRLEPASPATFVAKGKVLRAEELGRRTLSQADVQRNSEKALNWFRNARTQNSEDQLRSDPDMMRLKEQQQNAPRSPKKAVSVNLQKMRQAVKCTMAAKHIMNSGVQVGGGASLAARLRAKQMLAQ